MSTPGLPRIATHQPQRCHTDGALGFARAFACQAPLRGVVDPMAATGSLARAKERVLSIDRQEVAKRVRELTKLPGPGELLSGLQRVKEATRAVVRVDGAGLTLAHEGGPPRWVAVSDAAMESLEQVQHEFVDGPCVAAWAEDRIVGVEDLRAASAWAQVAAMVAQLQVRGVLSVPGSAGRTAGRDAQRLHQPSAGLVGRGGRCAWCIRDRHRRADPNWRGAGRPGS